jgi:hypothetical protein
MYFAQFYHRGVVTGELIEACGDRAVIVLDGRINYRRMGEVAEHECTRRGYVAWRVFKGEAFTRCTPVSPLHYVHDDTPVTNPSWLSAHGM